MLVCIAVISLCLQVLPVVAGVLFITMEFFLCILLLKCICCSTSQDMPLLAGFQGVPYAVLLFVCSILCLQVLPVVSQQHASERE